LRIILVAASRWNSFAGEREIGHGDSIRSAWAEGKHRWTGFKVNSKVPARSSTNEITRCYWDARRGVKYRSGKNNRHWIHEAIKEIYVDIDMYNLHSYSYYTLTSIILFSGNSQNNYYNDVKFCDLINYYCRSKLCKEIWKAWDLLPSTSFYYR